VIASSDRNFRKRATSFEVHDLSLIIGDLSEGGAQRVVCNLASAWVRTGRRVAVVTLAGPQRDFFQLDPGVTRIALDVAGRSAGPVSGLHANLRRVRALRQVLRQIAAPVAVAFAGSTNVLTVLAAWGLGTRLVISERNDPAKQSLGRPWNFLRKFLYRRADLVTANSHAALDTLSSYVPRERLAHVPNPVVFPTPLPSRVVEPLILNVGRLHEQKAQDVLMTAFAEVADEVPGWRLEILGTGGLDTELRKQITALQLSNRVLMVGQVDPWPHYARAAVFALPSRFEGTPNSLLEAMSFGIPPIVSNAAGGALEYVEHGVNGLVVPVDDAEALAAAIRELVNDSEFRERLGLAARDRVAACSMESALMAWDATLQLPSVQPWSQEAANNATT